MVLAVNFKYSNVNRAYCIARQGQIAINEAIGSSIFSGIKRNMLGAKSLDEIVEFMERK